MKKIVFCDVPMKKKLDRMKYQVNGDRTINYDGEVIFPINAILAKKLKKDDDVKVVLLVKHDGNGYSDINAGEYVKELNCINEKIGAHIAYEILISPFIETMATHEKLLKDMIDKLEDKAEVYADITYGPKPLPVIIFSVLSFAEKFFSAEIKNIAYGKVDFDENHNPINPELFDVASLYYLNAITNTIDCKNSDDAKKMLDTLLSM